MIDVGPGREEWLLSAQNACVACGVSYPEIAPRLFSWNNPHGACAACSGLGTRPVFDPARIVPDPSRPLAEAVEPWNAAGRRIARYYQKLLGALADHFGVDVETPWQKLPRRARDGILFGVADEIAVPLESGKRSAKVKRLWKGVVDELERRQLASGADLTKYASPSPCPDCGGSRTGSS